MSKLFEKAQQFGKSFMLPIAILPAAGLLLGIGGALSNPNTIKAYPVLDIALLQNIFILMSAAGNIVFQNLPVIFAVGVVLGVVAASVGFARRVAHLVEVELVDGYTYVVHGQLFFASSNDLVYAFDYTLDTDFVVVDLSDAEVWDASTVATLDAVQKKYADRGIEVEFRGLDGASAQCLERLSGQLGD